jgi:hypothetical protein
MLWDAIEFISRCTKADENTMPLLPTESFEKKFIGMINTEVESDIYKFSLDA